MSNGHGQWKRIDPPMAVARAMIATADSSGFRPLAGIVCAPTLRPDGSLLDRPNYDAASRLYGAFNPADFPPISESPSRDDAHAALAELREVFDEAVFAGGPQSPSASVAIAACMTACVRQALGLAPAFAFDARKAGSGKTTVAKVPALLATGLDPPVMPSPDDPAEFKKALLAILIDGDAVALIDNIARPVDSAPLCAALTSATYADRKLGVSEKAVLPTTVTWLMTGNSLVFVGDLTSRVLMATLDPEVEHPEARPFKRDLADYVLENRGRLVAACLTISLAYRAAGAPAVAVPRSRFGDWDLMVRYPLLWLGATDPLDTQAELRTSDPVRESLVALLQAWREAFGDAPATVAEAVTKAEHSNQLGRGENASRLLNALQGISADRDGKINARRLGRYLKRNVRRIEDGHRFEEAEKDSVTCRPRYRVTALSA